MAKEPDNVKLMFAMTELKWFPVSGDILVATNRSTPDTSAPIIVNWSGEFRIDSPVGFVYNLFDETSSGSFPDSRITYDALNNAMNADALHLVFRTYNTLSRQWKSTWLQNPNLTTVINRDFLIEALQNMDTTITKSYSDVVDSTRLMRYTLSFTIYSKNGPGPGPVPEENDLDIREIYERQVVEDGKKIIQEAFFDNDKRVKRAIFDFSLAGMFSNGFGGNVTANTIIQPRFNEDSNKANKAISQPFPATDDTTPWPGTSSDSNKAIFQPIESDSITQYAGDWKSKSWKQQIREQNEAKYSAYISNQAKGKHFGPQTLAQIMTQYRDMLSVAKAPETRYINGNDIIGAVKGMYDSLTSWFNSQDKSQTAVALYDPTAPTVLMGNMYDIVMEPFTYAASAIVVQAVDHMLHKAGVDVNTSALLSGQTQGGALNTAMTFIQFLAPTLEAWLSQGNGKHAFNLYRQYATYQILKSIVMPITSLDYQVLGNIREYNEPIQLYDAKQTIVDQKDHKFERVLKTFESEQSIVNYIDEMAHALEQATDAKDYKFGLFQERHFKPTNEFKQLVDNTGAIQPHPGSFIYRKPKPSLRYKKPSSTVTGEISLIGKRRYRKHDSNNPKLELRIDDEYDSDDIDDLPPHLKNPYIHTKTPLTIYKPTPKPKPPIRDTPKKPTPDKPKMYLYPMPNKPEIRPPKEEPKDKVCAYRQMYDKRTGEFRYVKKCFRLGTGEYQKLFK